MTAILLTIGTMYLLCMRYVLQMIDDVMSIQNGLLVAHKLSTSTSGAKPSGQPHVMPFDLNTTPIPASSHQSNSSESPRKLLG